MMCLVSNLLYLMLNLVPCEGHIENAFRFMFPQENQSNRDLRLAWNNLDAVKVSADVDCILRCYHMAKCVAVNIGPPDSKGDRMCETKSVPVTLTKFLKAKAGFTYFYIGKLTELYREMQ